MQPNEDKTIITDSHITKKLCDGYVLCTTYFTGGLYKILNITSWKYITDMHQSQLQST